ncbi:hypothetical protein ACFYUR_12535 [Micromonospora haikouensis]|uniref:hypothetical protein n=1 Tax=Micromonospora haikouensis TaxID=686309 RepID=UPI0036BDADA9
MARIRSVKPEYWADQDLAEQVSRDARLLYIGLWNLADEHSRLRGDPRYIKGQLFPYDDDLTPDTIAGLLGSLALAGKVVQYRTPTGTFIYLPKLAGHQRLEPDKVPTKLPGPDDDGSVLLTPPSEPGACSSAPRTNEFARHLDESSLLYGAGSMEHVSPSSAAPTDTDSDGLFDSPPPDPAPTGPEPDLTPSAAPKKSWTNGQIDADPHWVAFWEAYPRKTDKGHARKAWLKALRNGVDPGVLTRAAMQFRNHPKTPRDIKFVPHPTTWLNGERFNDYLELADAAPAGPRPWWEN